MLTMVPVLGLSQTAYADAAQWSENKTFNSNETFNDGVDVTNDITITIAEGKTVRVEKGIYAWGKTLTVEGKGNLIVNGINSRYGSGGSAFTGSIIVKGGKVTLTGGEGNPEGEHDTGGNGIEGNVEVRGGSFSATGGNGHTVGRAVVSSNTITCKNGIVAQESADGSEWSDISAARDKQYVRTIQTYPLWVGGTQVNSANAGDILGDQTASYVAGSNTLTLNNAIITKGLYFGDESDSEFGIYYNGSEPLIIDLADGSVNTVKIDWGADNEFGIYVGDQNEHHPGLNISGKGKLTVYGSDYGIHAPYITIDECDVTASGGRGIHSYSDVIINAGSKVTASGDYQAIKCDDGYVKNAIAGTGWTNTAGTEGEKAIAVNTDPGQSLLAYKKVQFPAAHTHSFTYTASGTTITATCSADGCPLPPSTTGGSDHVATLTIAAPDSLAYDGTAKAAKITDANNIQGAAKVQYQKKTGESYGTATENPPTDAGTYMASITLGTGTNSVTASVEYTIAQKPVTVSGITAGNKEYDGNTDASLNFDSAAVSGIEGGDTVELSTTSATGAFSDKTAGNGKTVTITGLALTGANASNYVLSSQPTTTANITKKAVTVTGITASNKVYDGTINATVNCGSAVINGKVDNDDLTFSAPTGSFSDKNVGEGKAVSFSGLALSGADAANYSLSAQPEDTTANITAKPVTITGVTAEDKVYDGNRTATAKTASAAIDGKVDSDDLSFVPGTGTFSNKNVGNNKTVSFSGFALTGNDSANYTLSAQPADTTAAITAKPVKVSGIKAENKTYDGTTDATLDCTSASFDGKLDDDVLTVTANGAFEDANADQDKTVNITDLTLGGTDKDNYMLAEEGQQTMAQADIAQKSITGAKVTLDKTQLTYNGQEQSVNVTGVKTSDGMMLTANDYEIVSGNTGTDIGDYTVIIEGKGNYKDEATADWKIVEKVSPTPTPTPQPAANPLKVTTTAKTSARSMTVKWTWNNVPGAKSYKVSYHKVGSKKWTTKTTKKTKYVVKGHKTKGLYEYKVAAVTASGDVWSDTNCRYFKTVKAKAKLSKGALKVSWKKDKGASGYEIFIARNKKMDGAQVVQVAPDSKSYSVTGLEKGRYYVKVRPMKNYNGVTYTGILCKAKKVRVK